MGFLDEGQHYVFVRITNKKIKLVKGSLSLR